MIATEHGKLTGVAMIINKEIVDPEEDMSFLQEKNFENLENKDKDGPKYIISSFTKKKSKQKIT